MTNATEEHAEEEHADEDNADQSARFNEPLKLYIGNKLVYDPFAEEGDEEDGGESGATTDAAPCSCEDKPAAVHEVIERFKP